MSTDPLHNGSLSLDGKDIATIEKALRAILQPGQVTELRVLGASTGNDRYPHTESGYFDDPEKMAAAVVGISKAKGFYFVPNPVDPSLLARAKNRIRPAGKEPTTSDADVTARRWLLIDVDPHRPSGISSSESEHEAALAKASTVRDALEQEGWPLPILADSGNGAHLLYRIDLSSDDDGLVKRCLEALAFRFDDEEVAVDQSVYNPARIWKLYGTMARKGDDVPDRPHRLSRLIDVPESQTVVSKETLEPLASSVPLPPKTGRGNTQYNGSNAFDLDQWISQHISNIDGPTPWKDGRKWVFPICPWNEGHTNRSAYIVQFGSGAIAAGCLHSGCRDNNWHSLREKFEPGWREKKKSTPNTDGSDMSDVSDKKMPRDSQADKLVRLAEGAKFFHDADNKPFVTITVRNHCETWPIALLSFRTWLRGRFWKAYQKAPGAQALQDALGVLSSKAIFDGKECRTDVRVAETNGAYWLDLGNPDWEAVKIAPDGWGIASEHPVKFLRPRGLLALPCPLKGGNINRLRDFVNLSSDADWVLVLSWLVAALRPVGPYPILVVNGEQGSAKSTLCRILRSIIDPNAGALRAEPREVRDLMIAASNSWVVAFDNISHIPPWLSDALCRLATGGGFAIRGLYTDNEEIIFNAMRPVILNGIDCVTTRSDLLDRSILLYLPRIEDNKRKTERELLRDFEESRPLILGALLDAASQAMAKLPTVKMKTLPRMADFAVWSVAAEEGLGVAPGSFMSAYHGNREAADDLAIETSAIGPAIQGFMHKQAFWEGTAQELLANLEHHHCPETTKRRRDWPKTPKAMGKALRRLAPNLKRVGIDVKFFRGTTTERKRLIRLERMGILASETSKTSTSQANGHETGVPSDKLDVLDKKTPDDSDAPLVTEATALVDLPPEPQEQRSVTGLTTGDTR